MTSKQSEEISRALLQQLQQGLTQLGLQVKGGYCNKLIDFVFLLLQWNRVYNLTAIHQPTAVISHHLLDSLSLAPFITGDRIIDVGSGAGFPGIPLALYYPSKHFVLIDSNGKKTRFLLQAKATFNISNVTVVHDRVERYSDKHLADQILARAVGSVAQLVKQTHNLLADSGQWLLMKGKCLQQELAQCDYPMRVQVLQVPGVVAERHVVIINKGKMGVEN